jgi:uncharacterized peroxidase-related enzyme
MQRPQSLLELFQAHPTAARPLIEYHEVLLRGPSALSVAERELIAAFVSALNACSYCHGIHAATAVAFGADPALVEALVADVEAAPIAGRLKPIFRLVRKLTLTPAKVIDQDRNAILDAGWPAAALHDVVAVCGLFNLMNRLVDGLGIEAAAGYTATSAARLHGGGYAALLSLL